MGKIRFSGPWQHSAASFLTLNKIALTTFARRLTGAKIEPTWNTDIEIGIRFWRHQFTKAMQHPDFPKGRKIFDSLLTDTNDVYDVTRTEHAVPRGCWHRPHSNPDDAVLLYLHGGGYAFHGDVSRRFADMLAHHAGRPLFAPDYRLTPEHPHPAQADDALAAWDYVTQNTPPERIILIGDSAGGHMALTLLQNLRATDRQQPALCIGLCPWTDIGNRGKSLSENNAFDMVQGWMALRFGEWLDPMGEYGRDALSPISHDFSGLAPIYMQAGGREILRDMIRDFADVQVAHGGDVMLDLWPDMPHDFQIYDSLKSSATQALARIRLAIASHLDGPDPMLPKAGVTVAQGGKFAAPD